MAYSKNVTVHGIEYSMLLKTLCRQYMDTNELEPSVDTLLSGIGSSGIAAVSKAAEPLHPLLFTFIEAGRAYHVLNWMPRFSAYA